MPAGRRFPELVPCGLQGVVFFQTQKAPPSDWLEGAFMDASGSDYSALSGRFTS